VIRRVGPQDVRFLRDMLRHAYHWRLAADPDLPVSRYVDNWGRRGDSGLVATAGISPVGAAWYRLFPADAPGFGFVDEETPELTIAVVPSRRHEGFGRQLLEGVLEHARSEGYDRVSLSAENEQTGLYERYGFHIAEKKPDAVTMVADVGD
jgi:ribosomal protein S18 acetylase RimI-like enzyme